MKIEKALEKGSMILNQNNISSSKLDSEILISKVLKRDRKFVIMNFQKEIEKNSLNTFMDLIKQRSVGKPIAYLIGKKDFWKYEFELNTEVLVPRPDTEIIIEEVLKMTKNKNKLNILDIGSGSGCIILSILKEKINFFGIGIDVSKNCVDLSRRNADKIGVSNRVKFLKSDIDNFKNHKYDLIVSNPPYISHADLKMLDRGIIDFEPILALDGGLDGLSLIRRVINKASKLIKINGLLILEIGFDQKERVKKILKNKGFYINKVLKDYANNDRCIISTKNNKYS